MKKMVVAAIGIAAAFTVVVVFAALQGTTTIPKKASSYAYVANAGSGTISVVDLSTFEVVGTITVGTEASHGIAISPDKKYVYVGYKETDEPNEGGVAVIDTSTKTILTRIPLNASIHGLDISRAGKYIYVDAPTDNATYAIDTSNNEIAYKIDLAGYGHMDLSGDDRLLYLTDIISNQTHVVDTIKNRIIASVPSGNIPNEPVVTPDGKYLFVANFGSSDVTVIRLADYAVVKTIQAGEGTHGVAVTPDGEYVWTANRKSSDVAVIDSNALRVVRIIPTGNWTNHVAFTEDGRYALVTSGGIAADTGTLSIVDTSDYRVVKTVKVGKEPHEISLEDQKPVTSGLSSTKDTFQDTKSDKGEGGVTAEATIFTLAYFKSIGKEDETARYDFDKYIVFRLSVDSHSVDLSGYNFEKSVLLRDSSGNQLGAVEWISESDDSHHRSGLIVFPRDSLGDPPSGTEYVEVIIRNLAGATERVLRWDAPIPGLLEPES